MTTCRPDSDMHLPKRILLACTFALLPLLSLSSCSSAPALPPACQLKPESGRCKASIMRYWYDEHAGCKAFIWGGCGGVVPFETMADCRAQCLAGQTGLLPDADAQVPAAPATGTEH